jgi:hypothetical protein
MSAQLDALVCNMRTWKSPQKTEPKSCQEFMTFYLWHSNCLKVDFLKRHRFSREETNMGGYNIFYIIGVVVVVLFILGYLGLR